jgi:positive regulator of sigma E activity
MVAVPEGTVLKAGLFVYLVPAAALLAGAVAGNALAPSLGLSRDMGAAALGLMAMGAALVASRFLGGGPSASTGPRITGREGS